MAEITNAQAVRFCNEQVRILADILTSALRTAQNVREFYYAHPELGTIFTDNMADAVIDGSQNDGRPIITGNDVLAIITRADEMDADYSANNNTKLNTLLRVMVNGASRV